jgi:hypothetical protein
MRDPNRIVNYLNVIAQVWAIHPDLRLGQLILNVFPNDKVLYNIEDDELVRQIVDYYRIIHLDSEE